MSKKDYSDIMNLPHPELQRHKRATRLERASQFGAFRALTGHEEAISETARLTDRMIFLDEYEENRLFDKLSLIMENIDKNPKVIITYFEPDEKKSGGKYFDLECNIKKIDEYEGIIITDEKNIRFDRIVEIQSELLNCIDI